MSFLNILEILHTRNSNKLLNLFPVFVSLYFKFITSQRHEENLALPSAEKAALECVKAGLETWEYKAKNALMYYPEGKHNRPWLNFVPKRTALHIFSITYNLTFFLTKELKMMMLFSRSRGKLFIKILAFLETLSAKLSTKARYSRLQPSMHR